MKPFSPISARLGGMLRLFIAVTFTVVMCIGTAARAGQLDPSHVPADAKWLIHIDQERLSDLELVREIRDMYPQISNQVQQWFETRYGIDPREGLHSITMFSSDYRSYTGTVILQTRYDRDQMMSKLHKNDSLSKTTWQGHDLYTVTLAKHESHEKSGQASHEEHHSDAAKHDHDHTGGKQMTVYLGDELIILASSVPNAKSTLRLLDGEVESLAGKDSPLIAEAPRGAVVYGAAIDLGQLERHEMAMPLLQQQEQCVYAFGQRNGKLFETLTLTSQSEEVADKTTEVIQGLIAYEQLCAMDSDALSEVINDVKFSRGPSNLTVSWEGETDTVLQAVNAAAKRFGEWMSLISG